MTILTQKEFAILGGNKILKKYGRKHFSEMGKKGAKTTAKRYGTDYFKRLSILGVAARKAKRDNKRTVVEKIIDIVKGGENNDSTR